MIWLVSLIEKTVCLIIQGKKDEDEEYRLRDITGGMLSTSELSILQAHKEIALFAERTGRMLGMVKDLFYEKNEDTFLRPTVALKSMKISATAWKLKLPTI